MTRLPPQAAEPSGRRAAAAVELALLLPFLALMVAVALDFARIFQATQVLETAASAGATYASGTAWIPESQTTAAAAAVAAAVAEGASLRPALQASQVTVSVVGNVATVTVNYDYPLLSRLVVPGGSVHLQRTVIHRVAPRPGQ